MDRKLDTPVAEPPTIDSNDNRVLLDLFSVPGDPDLYDMPMDYQMRPSKLQTVSTNDSA